MKTLSNSNLLRSILLGILVICGFMVKSQTPKTDTIYHQVFGCDSVVLQANGITYTSNTEVRIPHYATSQGSFYMDVLNIYNIEIGKSYEIYDTASAQVCENALPYAFRGHFFTKAGNYNLAFPTIKGCDSAFVFFKLTVLQGQRDTVRLGICSNQSSIHYNDMTFDTPGTFNFVEDYDAQGCPIVKTYVIEQYPTVYDSLTKTLCQSELPFNYQGQSFNAAGTYTVNYQTDKGCSATTILTLIVNPSSRIRQTIDTTICEMDLPLVFNNTLFTTQGVFSTVIPNSFGCDSVLAIIRLNVTYPHTDTLSLSLCPTDLPFNYNSENVFNDFGVYKINNNPFTKCSNYTIVELTPYPTIYDTTEICTNEDTVTFYDSVFTASGIYTIVDTNAYNCLDYHTLILTMKPVIVTDTVRQTICDSELPFTFHGSKYYSSGTYTKNLKSIHGCDSATVKLILTVNSHPRINESKTITRNEIPYSYRDTLLSASGIYEFVVPNAQATGCDTIEKLNLNVLPIVNVSRDTTVCTNEVVEFLGKQISSAGNYCFTYHLPTYDSVITLTVNHYPTYLMPTKVVTVGEYDLPYRMGDSTYRTTGYHEQILKTVHGCDSIVSIILNVNPAIINNDTIVREICSNELPYTIFDSTFAAGGVYRFLAHSVVNNFDSVFYLRLNVKESPALILPDTAYKCEGNPITLTVQSSGSIYKWSNGATTQSIEVNIADNYSVTTTNAYNCSSNATVAVLDAAYPTASITGPSSICHGSSATLEAMGGSKYLWGDGSTSDTLKIAPTTSTVYSVVVTNNYGCSKTESINISVNPLPQPEISGVSSICAQQQTTFVVTGGQTYLWSNNSTSDRIMVSNAGNYSVTVTDANGCKNTATATLTVNSLPDIRILGRTTFCQGGNTTLTASGASSYEWSSGQMTQSINVNLGGTYTVTGTDQNGCSSSKSVVVSKEDVNATITGNRYFCHGQSTTLAVSDLGNYTYHWFDGSTTNNISVSAPGQYTVTVTNANGCQNTLSATVSEYTMPNPSINGNLTICENQSTTLRATGGSSYIWDDGTEQALITVNSTGTYTVTVTNQYGCTASTSATVLVNPSPIVTILSEDNICSGETLTITAISNGRTYNWASGQTSATINVNPTHNTTYTVLVTDDNNCTTTASKTIVVNQPPAAYIEGNMTICSGDTAHLTAKGGVLYQWNNGSFANTIHVTNPNIYSVVVTNEDGCSATASANVVVNARPSANVTESVEICAGSQATLSVDAPSGCSYIWSTGSHQNQISVSEQNVYSVTVTNANQCSSIYYSNVVVRSLPQVSILGNSEFCYGNSTLLTASSGVGTQYVWNTDETNTTISVSTSGQYTVTATNIYNCSASATRIVTVHPLPTPQITGNLAVCKGSSTILTANGGSIYLWNENEETNNSITVTPEESKVYSVTVTSAFGCSATATASVVVNDLPQITFSGNTTICDGQTAAITAMGGINYSWSTNENTPTAHITSPGYYYVTASNSFNCLNTDSILVAVNPNPIVTISGEDHVCANTPTILTASGAQTYVWYNDENNESILINPTATRTYSVTGYDENGCSFTAVKNVLVEPLPNANIFGSLTICRGENTVLSASGGTTYMWSNGINLPNILVSPTQTTTYSVDVFNDFGCKTTTSATVNVKVLPTIIFSGETSICDGETTTINVSGASSFSWNNGTVGNTLTTNQPGVYTVVATNSLNCQRSDSVTITVWDNPTISIEGESLICQNSPHILAASGAESYVWNTNENTSTITITPNATTTYSVTGTDVHGCTSSVSKVVNVEALPNVSITGDLSICHDETTTLVASGGQTYLWNDGTTESNKLVSQYGSYSVTAYSANNCANSTSVTVVSNPIPTFSLYGSTTICQNTTETLYVVGEYDYLWNTGSTDTEIEITNGGIYSVVATNNYGCTLEKTIEVALLPAPFINVIGVEELCQGESTTLIAASNAQQFEWSTGDTTQSILVEPDNTTYNITVTGENGCVAEATHSIISLPVYNYAITASICEHNGYNQDGFEIPVIDTAGTYTFTQYLQTAAGCDSTINLLLVVNPLPRLDTITGPSHIVQYGNSYYSINNPQFVDNYEWRISNTHWQLQNNTYEIATLSVNTNGTGLLTARGINDCGYTETSLSIFCNVGIEDYGQETTILLYPNPVYQSLYVNVEENSDVYELAMYDEIGKLVYRNKLNGNNLEINCTNFANGHYTIHFLNKKGKKIDTKKIIVNNR